MNPTSPTSNANRPPPIEGGAEGTSEAGSSGLGASVSGVRGADGEAMQTTASLFHEWKLEKVNGRESVIGCLMKFIKKEPVPNISATAEVNGNQMFGEGEFIDPRLSVGGFGMTMAADDNTEPEANDQTETLFKVLEKSVVTVCTEERLELVEDRAPDSAVSSDPQTLLFKTNVTGQRESLFALIQAKADALNQDYLFAKEPSELITRDKITKIIVEASLECQGLGSIDPSHDPSLLFGQWVLLSGTGSGGRVLIKATEKKGPEGSEENGFTMHYKPTHKGPFSASGISGWMEKNQISLDHGDSSLLGPLDFGDDIQLHAACPNFFILVSGPTTYLFKNEKAKKEKSK